MYKKTISYTDYNGVDRTEDFYFNLSKAELLRLESEHPGGFEDYINRIIKSSDTKSLMECFEKIVIMAYGEKDETGRRFIKSEESAIAFQQTEAYSELIMELVSSADAASQFINSIVPKFEAVAQLGA